MQSAMRVENYTINEHWAFLVSDISRAFGLNERETGKLRNSRAGKLIGMLPRIAGTETPKRDGCSSLAVFLMSIRETKSYYAHQMSDDRDILARLHDVMHFNGGDRQIIRKGMSLLALMMINDYQRDRGEDRAAGRYNPISSGAWDYAELKKELIERIENCRNDEIDRILTISQAAVEMWE